LDEVQGAIGLDPTLGHASLVVGSTHCWSCARSAAGSHGFARNASQPSVSARETWAREASLVSATTGIRRLDESALRMGIERPVVVVSSGGSTTGSGYATSRVICGWAGSLVRARELSARSPASKRTRSSSQSMACGSRSSPRSTSPPEQNGQRRASACASASSRRRRRASRGAACSSRLVPSSSASVVEGARSVNTASAGIVRIHGSWWRLLG